ncbi:hypothetical protein GQ55_1G135900 [Panicum hallii var. hallii]|uniref:Uncharacterized protein n=1 Tax=Panicum hallii var. hallii TaxID=1504633 RepID=A0A2T7F546_9POAL|nr:hypothetical protein GQ55_1G135900 [Panicum hallii var. hallii]
MASSSSASSVISYESESSREPTPEYDPIAAYEARAPLHWDEEEWDFRYQSEDDESLTDGEDLALLLGAELEEAEDDAADSFSSEEDPMAGTFLLGGSSDDSSDSSEGAEGDDSFTSNDSGDDDDSGSDTGDSGPSTAPSPKRRKTSGVYWW